MKEMFDHFLLPLRTYKMSSVRSPGPPQAQDNSSAGTYSHETHIVKEGHCVTTVDGKHQREKAKKTGLKGCHAVLEVQVQHMSCQIQQMWMRQPCCSCGTGCDEEKLGQAEGTANW